ncbi:MAG: MarR family winged helix-turn-helix transcriptional regulator [Pseudonocardiaceae bacterium]
MSRVVRQRRASQREQGSWNQLVAFHARVSEMVEKALAERFGLSLSEYGALDVLAKAAAAEGVRMQALADTVGLTQSSVSRLVARLERQNLVERSLYEKDRRGVFTRITDAGRDLVAAATPIYLQTLAAAFDRAIADPDLQELVERIGR